MLLLGVGLEGATGLGLGQHEVNGNATAGVIMLGGGKAPCRADRVQLNDTVEKGDKTHTHTHTHTERESARAQRHCWIGGVYRLLQAESYHTHRQT